MNSQNLSVNNVCASLLVVLGLSVSPVYAEEVIPTKLQSDEHISVWVSNSSLSLFVSQLALMTGRQATIEGDLEGQVSGRFNGSMADALGSVSQQFPVLFDLDKETIAAVSSKGRKSVTIALGGSGIDDDLSSILQDTQLTGNEVQVRDGEVVVSGHPSFVERTSDTVTRVLANGSDPMLSAAVPAEAVAGSIGEEPVQVTDAASRVLLKEASEDALSNQRSDSASASRSIRWVTDIDGFDTF